MFKQLSIYALQSAITITNESLANDVFVPCSEQELSKMGFVPPLETSEQLIHQFGKSSLLVVRKEEKILPAHVISKAVHERVQEIERSGNRKLNKAERHQIKQDVFIRLLPRAFSKYTKTMIWIDHENQRISVDTASNKRAEEVLSLLRKALGSLPIVPFGMFETPVSRTITSWVIDEFPHYLQFDGKLKIVDEANASASFKDGDLNEEMVEIANCGEVKQVGLSWRQKINFVLDENFKLKNIKFSEIISEQNSDIDKSDYAQRFDADLILYTAELNELIAELAKEME